MFVRASAVALLPGTKIGDHQRHDPGGGAQSYLFGSPKVAITSPSRHHGVGNDGGRCLSRVPDGAGRLERSDAAGLAGLILRAVEGVAIYAVFASVDAHFTKWAFRSSMSAAA
jgi:hypothetical protein